MAEPLFYEADLVQREIDAERFLDELDQNQQEIDAEMFLIGLMPTLDDGVVWEEIRLD